MCTSLQLSTCLHFIPRLQEAFALLRLREPRSVTNTDLDRLSSDTLIVIDSSVLLKTLSWHYLWFLLPGLLITLIQGKMSCCNHCYNSFVSH